MTISRILNNRPGVSAKLKRRVASFIEKNGFSTNLLAGSLASGRTKTIGLLVPSVSYSFFPTITDKIEEACRHRNYYPILFHTDENYSQTVKGIRLMMGLRVAGLIITPPLSNRKEIYLELKRKGIPFVFIDRYVPGMPNSYVVTDGLKGGYEAVKYLIGIGHRDIVFISGPKGATSAQEIYLGYQKGIREDGIKEVVIPAGFEEEEGYRAAKKMVNDGLRPTAVMAVSDPVALGILKVFDEFKIKIPQDISLIGYCDNDIVSRIKSPLTTMREEPMVIGERAAEILFRMIEEGRNVIEQIKLSPRLIVRESTAPIRT